MRSRPRSAVATILLVLTLLVLRDRPTHAAPADEAPPAACDAPVAARAPDPRCGETLDGRAPAPLEHGVARGALVVPRVATRILLWPVIATSDAVEHHRLLDWMQAIFTSDDGLVGVRPILSYTTGFLPSVGVRGFYRRLPGHHELSAHVEGAGTRVVITRLHLRTLERMGIFADATWYKRDDFLFAGIGPKSAADLAAAGQGLARYGANALGADAGWSHWLPARLFVRFHADVLRRNYEDTSVHGGPSVALLYGLPPAGCAALSLAAPCVNPAEMPGFATGERLVHGGGGLGVDLRAPGREGAGVSALVDGTYAHGLAGDPSEHVTFSAEAVGAIGGANRALVLRGRAAVVEKLGDTPISFEELIMPAGAAGMRGFPEGRFRGESGVVGTVEYRWYLSSYLDASLFSDVGTVAGHNFEGMVWDRWFPSYGVGLRWFLTQGAYWEAAPRGGVQFAYSRDYGARFILSMAGF